MSLQDCTGRWASYCLSLTISPVIALAWYIHPSTLTASLLASSSSLGLAYALGAREGLIWSPFLALWAVSFLLMGASWGAVAAALAGALAVLAASRRPLSLTLAVIASPLSGWNPYLGVALAVIALLGPIVESRTLHSASLAVAAPLLVVLGTGWGLLLAASILVASTYLEGSLSSEKCPFRREGGLLAAGAALIAFSIGIELASTHLGGGRLLDAAGALWVMGFTLESSALLVPRGLGVLLRKAEAETVITPSKAPPQEPPEA